MIRGALIVAMPLALIACNAAESRGGDPDVQAAPSVAKAPPPRPANGSDLPARSVPGAMPDYNGIGPLHFGMTAGQMRKAWGLPLYGEAPASDPQACYYLRPQKDNYDLLFMVEQNRFARVDVKTGSTAAPGGGRVGADTQRIEKLYAGRVNVMPHKYDPAVKVLNIASPAGENAKLIFETDASGAVKSWRIGLAPQIDYVEGCG